MSSCSEEEKSSNPPITEFARRTASLISPVTSTNSSSGNSPFCPRHPRPISMIASGFLTSWAIPAASRPTDCIFSAWMSWSCAPFNSSCERVRSSSTSRSLAFAARSSSSARLRLVMSREIPNVPTILSLPIAQRHLASSKPSGVPVGKGFALDLADQRQSVCMT